MSSLIMSPARKVYIVGVWLSKILIIFLCLMGIFSILKQIGFISPSSAGRQVMEEVPEGSVVGVESRRERERLYERRREVAREVCEDQEERITLSTVKMYDLVPPAPIGRQAGEQCSDYPPQWTQSVSLRLLSASFIVPHSKSQV